VLLAEEGMVPFATGSWRPKVVLPRALLAQLDADSLELVLRHELTHVARGDQIVAAAVGLARLALAFHPTARALAAELGLAREEAVDATVAPRDPSAYAHVLVRVAELARFGPQDKEAVAMSDTSLQKRIHTLTEGSPRRRARLAPALALAVGLGALAVAAPPLRAEVGSANAAVDMTVGQHRRLSFSAAIERIAVGDPMVIDARPEGVHALELTGVAPGKTTVMVWTADHHRVAYLLAVSK
jgi:beta-lactamase regulating signal transducer with metallopeptidase domain